MLLIHSYIGFPQIVWKTFLITYFITQYLSTEGKVKNFCGVYPQGYQALFSKFFTHFA